jgi:hypothetical protein
MDALIVMVICAIGIATFVVYCHRKDRRRDREHREMLVALSPGPRIREMTTTRPSSVRRRRVADGSQPPAVSDDFYHVHTSYGAYVALDPQPHACAETPSLSYGSDSCAETPSLSYGGDSCDGGSGGGD